MNRAQGGLVEIEDRQVGPLARREGAEIACPPERLGAVDRRRPKRLDRRRVDAAAARAAVHDRADLHRLEHVLGHVVGAEGDVDAGVDDVGRPGPCAGRAASCSAGQCAICTPRSASSAMSPFVQ